MRVTVVFMSQGVRTPSATGLRQARGKATAGYAGGSGQLSLVAVAALALVLTVAGTLVDLAVSGQPGFWMGASLILGSVWAAARVRVTELRPAVVMVPLVYLAAVVIAAVISPRAGATSSLVTGRVLTIGTDCVVHAPSLLLAFGAALVLAVLRGRRGGR